ncbi:MAG: 3'-5' exonuclease, partial [Bacillota bacterium]|nr:3'-5' exonuclease [Bacillota bacterium]
IYDTSDQKSLLKKIIKEMDMSVEPGTMRDMISKYKNGSKLLMRDVEAEIMRRYNESLKSSNSMDFDDLIANVIVLLEQYPPVREMYNKRFRYIHVDEYQDTNAAQFRLIKLLSGDGNVFAVGDIDQSIYKWRGADISNIQNFERDFAGARLVVLDQNYRSTTNILNAANAVILNNGNRPDKNLWSDRGSGEKIKYFRANTDKEEAMFVAEEIRNLSSTHRYKDMAVLYRNNAQSRQIELVLKNRGIPYNVYGGHKFFDRKEIKDMTAYLKLIYNPSDNVSFERILNIPKRGIGATSMERLYRYAQEKNLSLLHAALSVDEVDKIKSSTKMEIRNFAENILRIHQDSPSLNISQIFQAVLDFTGIIRAYEEENTNEADSRIDNIYEFQTYVNENAAILNLSEFIEDTALRSDQDDMDYEDDKITLMTIHSAKGLEYDVIFLVGFGEDILPSARSKDDASELEEERRLCYVAITRAKKLLYLSNMKTRYMYGGDQPQRIAPSRFLKEIPLELLENLGTDPISFDEEEEREHSYRNDDDWGYGGYRRKSDYAPTRERDYSSYHTHYDEKPRRSQSAIDKSAYIKNGGGRTSRATAPEYRVGDKLVHDVFGDGIVIDCEKGMIRVAFENGIKKINPELAPIQKK